MGPPVGVLLGACASRHEWLGFVGAWRLAGVHQGFKPHRGFIVDGLRFGVKHLFLGLARCCVAGVCGVSGNWLDLLTEKW